MKYISKNKKIFSIFIFMLISTLFLVCEYKCFAKNSSDTQAEIVIEELEKDHKDNIEKKEAVELEQDNIKKIDSQKDLSEFSLDTFLLISVVICLIVFFIVIVLYKTKKYDYSKDE